MDAMLRSAECEAAIRHISRSDCGDWRALGQFRYHEARDEESVLDWHWQSAAWEEHGFWQEPHLARCQIGRQLDLVLLEVHYLRPVVDRGVCWLHDVPGWEKRQVLRYQGEDRVKSRRYSIASTVNQKHPHTATEKIQEMAGIEKVKIVRSSD